MSEGLALIVHIPGILPDEAKPIADQWATEFILLQIAIGTAGCILVSVVAVDAFRRAQAKSKLADALQKYPDWHLDVIKRFIEERFWHPVLFNRKEGLWEGSEFPPWRVLLAILATEPWGALAADALFQRSRAGRRRYFGQVVGRVRKRRGGDAAK
jgi:hypothetical protein